MLKAMETSEKDMFYIAVERFQRLNKQSDSNYYFDVNVICLPTEH